MNISSKIDHTILKPEADRNSIANLCKEAIEYEFAAVCVNPYYVAFCREILKDSDIKIATVIGFPLGANTSKTKAFETQNAIENGADEIDMVINIAALKDKDYEIVQRDIEKVIEAAGSKAIVKVIIETSLLTEEEKIKACEISKQAGADYVKTSTGFSSAGANVSDVKLMKSVVGDEMKVKASGGIRDLETAKSMIEAGASRLGMSSGVKIIKEMK